ncbi:MAG: QueT transporter family protein [Ruminococcaceae bacterium]|nr:QueT transporter family protein [Oscillospiraceae bacterium]
MKKQTTARFLVLSSVIASAYVVLTYISAALGLAYGGVQFRVSEALNILAVFTPAAIPGLTIGCFISNISSPFPLDMLFGTLATLLSVITIRMIAKIFKTATPYLCVLPPSIFNAVIIGLQITLFTDETASLTAFLISALSVFIGEFAVCTALGIPLYFVFKSHANKLL